MTPVARWAPDHQIASYRLRYPLGRGGMGEVWAAQRGPGGGRWLAIKLLRNADLDDGTIPMFLDEARTATVLRHPHIVPTFESGVERGAMFIAMELVRGPSLQRLVKRIRKAELQMPASVLAYLGRTMAAALAYAGSLTVHGRSLGLVHRDVSPHNILVNTRGRAFLSDFGVARSSYQEHRTLGGEVRGKPGYMSPEQVHEEPLDVRSDIFALGIVLWEAATLRRLFKRDTLMHSLMAVANDTPPPVKELRPDLPEGLADTIDRCLCKSPAERFQSARELEAAMGLLERAHRGRDPESELADLVGQVFDPGFFDPEVQASEATAPDVSDPDSLSGRSASPAPSPADRSDALPPTPDEPAPSEVAPVVPEPVQTSVSLRRRPLALWAARAATVLGLGGGITWALWPPEPVQLGRLDPARTPKPLDAPTSPSSDPATAGSPSGSEPSPTGADNPSPPLPESPAANGDTSAGEPEDRSAPARADRLVRAARSNDLKAVRRSARHEPIDGRGDGGWTALHFAAQRGHLEVARWLLRQGASVDLRTQDFGRTALMLAARYGDGPMVHLLLEAGADVAARDRLGDTALHLAVSDPSRPALRAVRHLVAAGSDVERTGQQAHTPLVRAVVQGHDEGLDALLDAGADPNRPAGGRSPLEHAAARGRTEAVQMLLRRGGRWDAAAVDAARQAGHTKLARELVARRPQRLGSPR
jgi:eukaryotic-like serine/threonine-protein kinase